MIKFEADELEGFAYDLGAIPGHLVPKVKGVVSKGALEIKKQLQAEARESTHFSTIARTIGYDLNVGIWAGDASIEAEIGPDPERGGEGSGAARLLGAYWGWSRGGGGTLPDPMLALEAEEPWFVQHVLKAAEDVI